MKQKLTLKYTRLTENTEELFTVEYESEEQVDPSSQSKIGLVSDYLPVIVSVVINVLPEVINFF